MPKPILHATDDAVDAILAHAGAEVVLATPLGLGKPNALLNALYRRVAAEPARRLTIFTALSLARPHASSFLERRFLEPFVERHFGSGQAELDHVAAMRADRLPANIHVREFYFQSGAMLGSRSAQSDHVNLNYTHVARDLAAARVNTIVQLVARRGEGEGAAYSLASNPDVSLDLVDALSAIGAPRPFVVGVVCTAMPFLAGEACVDAAFFDAIVDEPATDASLFALPREDVDDVEHAIGLHASTLVRDGGTLQIGIGALADALVHALMLRQRDNRAYRQALASLGAGTDEAAKACGGIEPFERGLYGSSEMVMDGFMHLRRGGILTRRVFADAPLQRALDGGLVADPLRPGDGARLREAGVVPARLDSGTVARLASLGLLPADSHVDGDHVCFDGGTPLALDLDRPGALVALDGVLAGRHLRGGRYLHGGFLLGSVPFYDWLRTLQGEDFEGLQMGRISRINALDRANPELSALQRRDARFFNTCMMATVLGAAVSDALEDERVVSGVGGQYNFVALAHALDGARSVLMLRSTRSGHDGRTTSNLRWNYGHTTIPRHLRDVFVTEYGVADLRGKSDRECVLAMLAIADARFHDELVASAVAAGKLPRDFRVPEAWRGNTPRDLAERLGPARRSGVLPDWPFGSDFDATERQLLPALARLRLLSRSWRTWPALAAALWRGGPPAPAALARIGLDAPRGWREHAYARLLRAALAHTTNAKA